MEHWTGIQPKANNHQKNLTNKQPIGRSKQANPNLTKNMTDNAINEEVARAVQKLIALNKADQATVDEEMSELAANDDSADQLTTEEYTDHTNPEGESAQTPETVFRQIVSEKQRKEKNL